MVNRAVGDLAKMASSFTCHKVPVSCQSSLKYESSKDHRFRSYAKLSEKLTYLTPFIKLNDSTMIMPSWPVYQVWSELLKVRILSKFGDCYPTECKDINSRHSLHQYVKKKVNFAVWICHMCQLEKSGIHTLILKLQKNGEVGGRGKKGNSKVWCFSSNYKANPAEGW